MKRLLLFIIFFTCSFQYLRSQDIMGGEIHYQYISGYEYHIEAYLFIRTSLGIDHSTIYMNPGGLVNGVPSYLINDVTMWYYEANNVFPGSGNYNIYATDSFRIANIANINNSSAEGITLSATLNISSLAGPNNSPTPFSPQTDIYEVAGNWVFYGEEQDADNDSLVYSLVPTTSSNYSAPPGITINPATGTVQMPAIAGNYAINIRIDEWRSFVGNPYIVATTYREMNMDSGQVVGIKNIDQGLALNMYPNPVSFNSNSHLTFTHPPLNNPASIIINNIDGKEVMRYQAQQGSSNEKLKLPELAKGVYVARMVGEGVNGNVKFVIE